MGVSLGVMRRVWASFSYVPIGDQDDREPVGHWSHPWVSSWGQPPPPPSTRDSARSTAPEAGRGGGLDDGSSPLCPQCGQVTFGMEPVLPLVADDDAEALPDGEALQPGPSRLGASHHGGELLVGK